MKRRPPTWGSTARLAAGSLLAVLLALGGLLAAVLYLAMEAPPETASAALAAVERIGGAAMLALGGAGAVGAGVHGARHLGGQPAPTSAELSRPVAPAVGPGEV